MLTPSISGFDATAEYIKKGLGSDTRLDAIINVAGGWAGGNVASKEMFKNTELMYNQSVVTSVVAAKVASEHLNANGLMVLSGAAPCVNGTPEMIG